MSKASPGNRPSKTRNSQPATRNPQLVLIIVAILAAIPFGLGKYMEFNTPGPYDSASNVYSAKHILEGARIGIEEKPSAALGTLLVNIVGVWLFGFNEIGPKLIQGILQAAMLVFMFVAMRKLFGTLSAAVGVIIASVYLSAPLIAKFGNVKEQYMIAFMVMAISCFVLRQLGGTWWLACLAGAFVSWAPLFKETGTSALGAIGLFVILQPVFKHRTPKQTGVDILLLLAGAAAALAPLYVWIIAGNVHTSLPYSFLCKTVVNVLPVGGADEQVKPVLGYVAGGHKLIPFSQQWPRVLRYYAMLILPIALAAGAIIARIIKMIRRQGTGRNIEKRDTQYAIRNTQYDRFVLLFAIWWLLDMVFVWVSPRSYEQYYLPLNASAAMLGGYLIALYSDKFTTSSYKGKWLAVGFLGLLAMIIMSWHIFFGIEKSPHTGRLYGERRRGYTQRLEDISRRKKQNAVGAWEVVGEYIRKNSQPADKIYVWGWVPGIYVAAQRFSSASEAFMMPRSSPEQMAEKITGLIAEFERDRPRFIVDTRKRHVPMERPPYELWPIVPKGFVGAKKSDFLPLDKNIIAQYDTQWSDWLRKNFDEDEALRYQMLKPFREFVMNNYRIVRMFGQHVLFQLKNPTPDKELQ
jgi:hypothetical protein